MSEIKPGEGHKEAELQVGGSAPARPLKTFYNGPVSMWLAWKMIAIAVLCDLTGIGLAIAGTMNAGTQLSSVLIVVGVALFLASSLMLAWAILSVRFQRYTITNRLIERQTGVLSRRTDALDLARVKDVQLTQGLADRMLGLGTIEVFSVDRTDPVLFIEGLPQAREVYEQLRDAVIEISQRRGIVSMNQ